jgi:hypothetical protein
VGRSPPEALRTGFWMSSILSDLVEEGIRLVETATAAGARLKLIGGVAVALTCRDALTRPELSRTYKDLDFVAPRKHSSAVRDLLSSQGYKANQRFNALHGSSRLLFYDPVHARQLDVFVGTFDMCHRLDLEDRFGFPGAALPAADLLMLKMQVVHLNEKDLTDALALLLQNEPVATDTGAGISVPYIAAICANDWGWYTSFTDNLAVAEEHAPDVLARQPDAAIVRERAKVIKQALESAPKSLIWKLRAGIGRRVRWYEVPEEVD